MKTFNTFAELEKEFNSFDFSKIELYPVPWNPIFWEAAKETFVAYPDNTQPETAEQQNDVMFVGWMKKGGKPDLWKHEDRIKTHFTHEIH